MLSTRVRSALHTSLHPSPPITSLHCNRSWHMPAQQKPSGGAGLRQEALRDWQPEGTDSALLQAGAPADVSSGSPTAIAFSVTLALKPTSHTYTHTHRLQLYCGPIWIKGFYCAVKSFFFFLDRWCSAAFLSLRLWGFETVLVLSVRDLLDRTVMYRTGIHIPHEWTF